MESIAMILAGLGWLLVLLLLGGKKKTSAPTETPRIPAPPPNPVLPAPKVPAPIVLPQTVVTLPAAGPVSPDILDRIAALLKRALTGARWIPLFDHALSVRLPLLPPSVRQEWSRDLGAWAGLESGGNPMAKSSLGEIGLLQIGLDTLSDMIKAGILSAADESALRSSSTPDAIHADIAVRFFLGLISAVKRKAPAYTDPADQIWAAKMQHALPLMLTELGAQGILGANRVDAHRNFARYKPSAKVASFADPAMSKKSGASFGLEWRFFPPADVVADGENARLNWT